MTEILNRIEKEVKEGCEDRARTHGSGTIEVLQERVDHLENMVAHLCGFIVEKMWLTDAEIHDENGLLDF